MNRKRERTPVPVRKIDSIIEQFRGGSHLTSEMIAHSKVLSSSLKSRKD